MSVHNTFSPPSDIVPTIRRLIAKLTVAGNGNWARFWPACRRAAANGCERLAEDGYLQPASVLGDVTPMEADHHANARDSLYFKRFGWHL
ncbi:MAG: hypothetical protein KDA62_14975, partial [Planctomycetales bacterium]|nr:hypothetical protein [Planctomycetales bacterium]